MKTLIIGDIHGEITKLKALIEKAGPVDEIISVGDLIDRGEDSKAVIDLCKALNIKVCKGNHELMAQEVLEEFDPTKPFNRMWLLGSDWFNNGGEKVYRQYEENPSELLDFIKDLPIYIKTIHTHEGLPIIVSHTFLGTFSNNVLNATNEDLKAHESAFLWTRSQPNKHTTPNFFNIFGHTPTDYLGTKNAKPITYNYGINLDTGACYNLENRGKLTGILLPEMEVIQA